MKFLFIFLVSLNVFAHENHSWLTDLKAFKSVKKVQFLEIPMSPKFEDISIDPAYLKTKLEELSGAVPVVINGKEEIISERKSAKYRILTRKLLIQEYEALGFQTSILPYGPANTKGVVWGGEKARFLNATKANFMAEKVGADPNKVLIISSHLDSVGNAGANDDGSGTISALAIARALRAIGFDYTLRILAFDQEELGLIGSAAYARAIPMDEKDNIIGVINLEMMATNSRKDGAFHIIDCDKQNSLFLTAEITKAIQSYNIDLTPTTACTDRSDHASFWKRLIPAVVLSENFFGGDSDKCYHKACDVVDGRLDFNYMAKITQAVAIAAREILVPLKE